MLLFLLCCVEASCDFFMLWSVWSCSTIYLFCPKTAHSLWAGLPHVLIQFSFSSAAHCSVPYCPTNMTHNSILPFSSFIPSVLPFNHPFLSSFNSFPISISLSQSLSFQVFKPILLFTPNTVWQRCSVNFCKFKSSLKSSFPPVTRVRPGLSDSWTILLLIQTSQANMGWWHDNLDTTWVTTQETRIQVTPCAGNGGRVYTS